MNTTTIEDFLERIIEYNIEQEDGSIIGCPTEVIKTPGKPDRVRAFYNGRWYVWELIE